MYIQRIYKKTATKTYTSVYLVENYREGNKVKHRLISNLSKWPQEMISNFEALLKGQKIVDISNLELSQGKSFGAIYVISEIAKRLGISAALGNTKQAKLALLQIAGRIITQGSRNHLANEWVLGQSIDNVFNIKTLSEDDLYKNLIWLSEEQSQIEQRLFKYRNNDEPIKKMFLYDVTSSYLEGDKNELGEFGYNRDKKKGKKQIVIGLLTDDDGYPVSVEVFKGNTGDTKTVSSQLEKIKHNFGVEKIIFVGDKGMIKSAQIEELTSNDYQWDYLTTITKQQIQTLISEDVIQLELFEDELIEVEVNNGIRYILRRNSTRATELKLSRQSKIDSVKKYANTLNVYLEEHQKAKTDVALRKIEEKISTLKLNNFIIYTSNERIISIETDNVKLAEYAKLDGCYVVKTNVPKEYLDKQTAHDRYKDLAQVEFAFRTMKTTLEEVRPIFVRKAEQTRGHVFVVMLGYMIVKYITDKLSDLNYSRKWIIESLDKISYLKYSYEGKTQNLIPQNLPEYQQKILDGLDLTLK